jgi:hypothetical protein
VTVGCLEVPRMTKPSGFGVDARLTRRTASSSFVEKAAEPAAHAWQAGHGAVPAWAMYVFDAKFLIEELQARRGRPELAAHDFGKDIDPLHRRQRQGGRPSLRAAPCVESRDETKAVLARRRHARRLLGGRTSTCTDVVPELDLYDHELAHLDLRRDHAAGEVRPRRATAGAARRWPRWCRAAASSPARRCSRSLLFTGVHMNSYSQSSRTR